MKDLEVKKVEEKTFLLKSVGLYLKIPSEAKSKFGFNQDMKEPLDVTVKEGKDRVVIEYTFTLEGGKVAKEEVAPVDHK